MKCNQFLYLLLFNLKLTIISGQQIDSLKLVYNTNTLFRRAIILLSEMKVLGFRN